MSFSPGRKRSSCTARRVWKDEIIERLFREKTERSRDHKELENGDGIVGQGGRALNNMRREAGIIHRPGWTNSGRPPGNTMTRRAARRRKITAPVVSESA